LFATLFQTGGQHGKIMISEAQKMEKVTILTLKDDEYYCHVVKHFLLFSTFLTFKKFLQRLCIYAVVVIVSSAASKPRRKP